MMHTDNINRRQTYRLVNRYRSSYSKGNILSFKCKHLSKTPHIQPFLTRNFCTEISVSFFLFRNFHFQFFAAVCSLLQAAASIIGTVLV